VAAAAKGSVRGAGRGAAVRKLAARGVSGGAAALLGTHPVLQSAKVFGSANLLGLGISLATGSHAHVDLVGTGAFVAAAFATRGQSARQLASTAMVAAWGTRLAAFLFYRANRVGHDARLEQTLSTTSGAVGFWAISCAWGIVVMLPHTLGAAAVKAAPLGAGAAAAGVLYVAGLALEICADAQKWVFKGGASNRGKVCDAGVWGASQHPNWLGNLALWCGIFAINAPVLSLPALAAAALSPVFLGALFLGQATGAVTNTVELADEKYAQGPHAEAYHAYVETVPLLFASPVSIIAAAFKRSA